MNPRIAIIGAGPAGCALAMFLQARRIDCVVYDDEQKPDLIVGESLVSAVMPILRRLNIEEQVAAISTLKHGAALRHVNGTRIDFRFRQFGKEYPDYSYNIPRPEFDQVLRQQAATQGVRFVNQRATVEASHDPERDLQLTDASLQAADLSRATQPTMLVDATGRSRLFSRALKLPAEKGGRNDISYFAHYEGFAPDGVMQGQVVTSVLDNGWSWQIPVKNYLSVGVVLNKDVAKSYGSNAEQRLETAIERDLMLSKSGAQRKRVSSVKSYSNYQLISKQGFGKGWVLLGDAFGFVDPMLSPGVFMGLKSAVLLDKVLSKTNYSDTDLQAYCAEITDNHAAWNQLIEHFYNGRLLSLAAVRHNIQQNNGRFSLPRLIEPYISRVISSLVSGVKTHSQFNQAVLEHSLQHMLKDETSAIAEHAIRTAAPTTLRTAQDNTAASTNKVTQNADTLDQSAA